MQNAEYMLQAIRKLGEKRKPLTRVYRCLFNEDLFLMAYNKIGRNKGALTPGTTDQTVDGMSLARIGKVIHELRQERFRFTPVRRTHIPRRSGGSRPLGMPDFEDKLVQEAIRLILEAYYEPCFAESSHGFRPGRGCHTALTRIKVKFKGSSWFIEGDIRGCFDNINHAKLMEILSRDIHDGRLLNLIRMSLEAGYLENWTFYRTYSGTPQGGVLSPILANIYLNELDSFIENELIPQYTRGKCRARPPAYSRICYEIRQARRKGRSDRVRELEQRRREMPSQDTHDPEYRRLTYVRYADDWLLGFIGPKSEVEQIKAEIGKYLWDNLKLEMSDTKTLITHSRTEQARFLGYAISIYHANDKISPRTGTLTKARSLNGGVRLGIPYGLVDKSIQPYLRNGKPIQIPALLFNSDAHIIDSYQRRYRGVAEYYKYAVDRHRLGKLKHAMEISLTKTLANKFRTHVTGIYKHYKGSQTVNGRAYKTLQVEVPTKKGTRTIYWGAIPLTPHNIMMETLIDEKYDYKRSGNRADFIQRLQANQCELCGVETKCEVHHVRKLSNLKQRWAGRRSKPEWVTRMIALQRKTLVVCAKCHDDIHAGRPIPSSRKQSSREPDDAKVSSPVWRGDCEKVPAQG